MSEARPIKVAVVGGGCAAMAAAFELTRPEHRGRYEVTVYQVGWRLGGKGASGRGPAGRIEEHGLHLWMGFYENAFRLMRECYAELGRDPARCPISDWQDAFEPWPLVGVADRASTGEWEVWRGVLPPIEGLPGDPARGPERWTIADYLLRSMGLVRALLETIQRAGNGGAPARAPFGAESVDAIAAGIARILQVGEIATLTGLIQAVGLVELALGSLARFPDNLVMRMLDAIGKSAREVLATRLEHDPGVRRIWHIIDLTLATIRGGIRSGLMTDPRGFDAIDEFDSREWLRLNGAAESSLASGYLRALYDFGFSYEGGDPTRPRISAGQALRSMVRAFFTYRGAFFWRMTAGMGDVVFAPFYEVLRRRGVRFEFFHRVTNVKLVEPSRLGVGEKPYVEALEIDVQARTAEGGEYRPLVDVGGLPCWPSEPDWRQLADGAALARERPDFESHWERRSVATKELRVGDDFDFVVLGIGLGAVPYVCRELVERDPRWRAMVDRVPTVATQAFQLWMRADMKDLGWTDDPIVISGFVEPFDTWADMRHLARREAWPEAPRSIAYFCNVLPDPAPGTEKGAAFAAAERERVRRNAIRFLDTEIRHLWPSAAGPTGFRWDLLLDGRDGEGRPRVGAERFASQFWTANVNPSDRYALSVPGSSAYRLSPLDATYDNLTVAGDWTDCGFNAGCVEAAVMSGRLAAHALSHTPPLDEIVGFDHP